MFGSITGSNVAIDGNEIMARNNGATSSLYLNNNGGDVVIGGSVDIGYEIVSRFGSKAHCISISCPAGKQVVGGGCNVGYPDYVVANNPTSNTSWECCGDETDSNVTVHAICANVK